jgi:hypothetical protein
MKLGEELAAAWHHWGALGCTLGAAGGRGAPAAAMVMMAPLAGLHSKQLKVGLVAGRV